jgi:GMP synthase-like glutamine amidotransferase
MRLLPPSTNNHTTAGAAGVFPLRRLGTVRVLSLIQQADAPMGTFADVVRERGDDLLEWTASNGPPPENPEAFDAAFVLGGAMHVDQEEEHPWLRQEHEVIRALLDADVPTFGVCLGGQLVARVAGAHVGPAPKQEIGWHEVELSPEGQTDPIFGELPDRFPALQWHSYAFELPSGAVALATSPVCLQAFRLGQRAWGVQFHPEVTPDILAEWFGDYESDPDAVALGFDPAAAEREARERLAAWNAVGGTLFDAFIRAAR